LRSREQRGRSYDAASLPKYYGVLPMEASYWGGLGYIGGTSSIGLVDQTDVAAHEIGHNVGLPHVDCGGPAGTDPNYPYTGALIGNVGVDVYQQKLVSASEYKDLMSYCWPKWLSDYNYQKIFNVLSTAKRSLNPQQSTQTGWLISGRINPDGTGTLNNPESVSSADIVAQPGNGLYQLELLDQTGTVQFSYSFSPMAIVAEDETPQSSDFDFVVPQIANLSSIQLRQGNTLLASMAVGTTPVLDVSQSGSSSGDPNELTLSWEVGGGNRQTDKNTTINVRYSADSGQTWQYLAVGQTGKSLDLSKTQLAASTNGLIEIVAHNATQATVKQLAIGAVTNKTPIVGINGVTQTIQLYQGEALVLEGAGFDFEDGTLGDNNLTWSSPAIATVKGHLLILPNGLSVGQHTLTLTGVDSAGNSAQATANIEVKVTAQSVYLPLIIK
jgi:hypothetical protein